MIVADESTSLSLLIRARDKQPEAWNRLVYLYTPLVERWCRSWGLQGSDVDDIRQDVFQSVATNLEAFRHDRPGDTFRGWLRVIARRKFLDHCRRSERQPKARGGSDAHVQMQQIPEPDDIDAPEEMQQVHHRALEMIRSQFEERTWQAFWRCAVLAQAPDDVGRDMSMTPTAVRKAKSRVLQRLKAEYGELLG
jgi:RNA polymerase sigma-70 factor (ECF subfamily)